jgi:hypothetical protein
MPRQSLSPLSETTDTRVAVVLAVAAIVAAAMAAWATLLTSTADDRWQRADRGEVKLSANVVNDTITAYDQVPLAETAVEHRYAAYELQKLGAPSLRRYYPALYSNWVIESGASKLTPNEAPWVRRSGVFEIADRIAALRRRDSGGVPPSMRLAEGDNSAHRAFLVGLGILPAALGFFAAATARAFRRLKRVALMSAIALVSASVIVAVVVGVGT